MLAGSLLHNATELESLGQTSIRFLHRTYDSETGEEVASGKLVGVYFDTANRSATPLPPAVFRRAGELRATPAGVEHASGNAAEEMAVVT